LFTLAKTTIVCQVTAVNPLPSRRERVRAATRTELTAAARQLLLDGGTEAVTVRSIAARLGMTAPAIYRYFDGREALLNALVDELYDELADHLYAARESFRSGTLAQRFMATSRAFRLWALSNPREFGLLFGAPIPGVGKGGRGEPADLRGHRFGRVWLDLFVELVALNREPIRWHRPIPARLRAQLEEYVRQIGEAVDVDTALLFLSCWEKLYGAVCTEAFGHLHFALDDAEELFEDQLADVAERLGLDVD
jgi:AcrR family transcriptional regulator